MKGVTARQVKVLEAIDTFISAHGHSPTVRELADALSITWTRGMTNHLDALEKKGLATRAMNVARSIRLTDSGKKLIGGEPVQLPKQMRVTQLRQSSPPMPKKANDADATPNTRRGPSMKKVSRSLPPTTYDVHWLGDN